MQERNNKLLHTKNFTFIKTVSVERERVSVTMCKSLIAPAHRKEEAATTREKMGNVWITKSFFLMYSSDEKFWIHFPNNSTFSNSFSAFIFSFTVLKLCCFCFVISTISEHGVEDEKLIRNSWNISATWLRITDDLKIQLRYEKWANLAFPRLSWPVRCWCWFS